MTRTTTAPGAPRRRSWFSGPSPAQDVFAGLTLAAIAVPEQMATARLGQFPPELGFLAFVAGTVGFLIFGASRTVSVGADSTITPIFAGSLAVAAAAGSPSYAALSVTLAVMVGLLVALAGVSRLGWISNLLSVPVTTGFLAGIAVHIAASQLPALCGVPAGAGEALARLADFAGHIGQANIYATVLGLGVLVVTAGAEKLDHRWPGALIGVAAATAASILFAFERHGVRVLGAVAPPLPRLPHALPSAGEIAQLIPLSILISLVVMVQSAATTRSFAPDDGAPPDINRDFVGIGVGNILSGLAGAFAVNASPPRTAVATEAGARSKAAGLVAAVSVALLACFGAALLARIPVAALAGVLLFVAMRIVRIGVMRRVWRESKTEFALIVATALAIVILPIETGVGVGILLSLFYGVWTTTRAQIIALGRIPGTTIWWPRFGAAPVEEAENVLVLAFQAPLSFLNADAFRRGFHHEIARRGALRLVVLEASGIVEIDFSAAQMLTEIVGYCRDRNIAFALARLESVRAQLAVERFGISELIGHTGIFHSVREAVDAFAHA